MATGKLTHREQAFCREYVVDYNPGGAAERAGVRPEKAAETAWQLLQRPEVLDEVRALQAERVRSMAVTQEYVIEQLVLLYRQCVGPACGGEAAKPDSRGALRVLELLGKYLGVFGDRLPPDHAADTGQLEELLAQLQDPAEDEL